MTLAKIQIRRDTASAWAASNPVLGAGEPGYDTTARRMKVGDGVSAWSVLQWQTMDDAKIAELVDAAAALEQGIDIDDAKMALVAQSGGAFQNQLNAEFAQAFAPTAITYDSDGNVATVTESGITTTYTYNADDTVATDTRLGVTRAYTYDGAGNVISIEEVS